MLIKTKEEIRKIKAGGKIIGEVLSELSQMAKPGVSTLEIDERAEKLITKAGGRPSFKGYMTNTYDPPFPTTICASLNHGLVHGIAKKETILQNGDVFSIDIGMEWPTEVKGKKEKVKSRGYFTDTAITLTVGEVNNKTKELLRVTRSALEVAIKTVKPGISVADIGGAIEKYVKSQGKYGIIRDLVGHGVGHEVHEEPRIPNYYDKRLANFILKPGMVIAIEPMISLGGHEIQTASDGWTIEMTDGSMCSHYEHTIAITKNGCEVMTRRPNEKKEKFW